MNLKTIKRKYLIRKYTNMGAEIYHKDCECGGKLIQMEYNHTADDTDGIEVFIDYYDCKCTDCGKRAVLPFIIET